MLFIRSRGLTSTMLRVVRLVVTLYIVSVISMQFTLNILPFFIRQYLLYTRADVTSVIGVGLAAGFLFLVFATHSPSCKKKQKNEASLFPSAYINFSIDVKFDHFRGMVHKLHSMYCG